MNQKGLVKIFEIEGGKLELSVECYTEPYLKAIIDRYSDPIPALCYIYYKTYPWSMYNNYSEDVRDEAIFNTYPGEYKREDEEIVEAVKQLTARFNTPLKRFYESQRKIFDVLSAYYSSDELQINDDGMRGNLKLLKDQLKQSKETAASFLQLENLYKEEIESRIRGGIEEAYDEDFE